MLHARSWVLKEQYRPEFTYRPEIDGLRSIAVLSVFLFHLDNQLLMGGFVGVDVFFVISGFLITSLLLNDIDHRRFSIVRFYQRRIARIAPMSSVVLATSIFFGYLLYSLQDFASLGANSLAAAISLINLKLLFQGGYFHSSPDAQPIIHYWSLAIEEQYYILLPTYLLIITKLTKYPSGITYILCCISLALCAIITPINSTCAFYLLPTRAWELFVGSGLAMARRDGYVLAPRSTSMAGWGGERITSNLFRVHQRSQRLSRLARSVSRLWNSPGTRID